MECPIDGSHHDGFHSEWLWACVAVEFQIDGFHCESLFSEPSQCEGDGFRAEWLWALTTARH